MGGVSPAGCALPGMGDLRTESTWLGTSPQQGVLSPGWDTLEGTPGLRGWGDSQQGRSPQDEQQEEEVLDAKPRSWAELTFARHEPLKILVPGARVRHHLAHSLEVVVGDHAVLGITSHVQELGRWGKKDRGRGVCSGSLLQGKAGL